MAARDPKTFDPTRAHVLDAAQRDAFLPDRAVVDAVDVSGGLLAWKKAGLPFGGPAANARQPA